MGDIDYCIGIHVERDRPRGIIYLDQRKYIEEVLNKYGMSDCKTVNTPIDMNTKVQSKSEENKILNVIPYQEILVIICFTYYQTRHMLCYKYVE